MDKSKSLTKSNQPENTIPTNKIGYGADPSINYSLSPRIPFGPCYVEGKKLGLGDETISI